MYKEKEGIISLDYFDHSVLSDCSHCERSGTQRQIIIPYRTVCEPRKRGGARCRQTQHPLFTTQLSKSSFTMSATTDYELLCTEETGPGPTPAGDWRGYPARRRTTVEEEATENDFTFVRTGGNALQAIPKRDASKENMISVVVPEGKDPGDDILVACPFVENRLISVKIPGRCVAGSVFLVQAPPINPTIITGIPVDMPRMSKEAVGETSGNDLALEEGTSLPRPTTRQPTSYDEEEYEMIEKINVV